MLARRLSGMVGLIAAVAACDSNSPAGLSGRARNLEEFEARVDRVRGQLRIPGAGAAIVANGRVAWSSGFGFADVERSVPATASTSFHVASLTKGLAGIVLMRLVETGKVSLDDPVSKYGLSVTSSGVVRVRHLASMTSEGTPGDRFSYNGDRFALLDQVIRSASGRSFADVLFTDVLKNMTLSRTAPNSGDQAAFPFAGLQRDVFDQNLARGYEARSSGPLAIAYPTSFSAAAGLVSSALDMAEISMAIDSGAFVTASSKATLFEPAISTSGGTLPYAVGWFSQIIQGVKIQWGYGYWTGNSSLLIRVPERGLTFVILANSDGLSASTRLGAGDLMSSPMAKEFLNAFVFGDAELP